VDLSDVDVPWVRTTLEKFVREAAPVNQSSDRVVTSSCEPFCGRDEAITQSEVIKMILDRLYPKWQFENPKAEYFEFAREHDASKRLLARLSTLDEVSKRLGDSSPRIAAGSFHPLIWKAAEAQWSTGHRHEAVLAAAKSVNSQLQTKVGRRDVSEKDLVQQAFSNKCPEPGKARLRFPNIEDQQTRESVTQGVLSFGTGCFQAIRNPLGHRPNEEIDLDDAAALERMAALSLLARWIDEASVLQADDVAQPN
jgi:uncharacterized protein (TIGR02391 family)